MNVYSTKKWRINSHYRLGKSCGGGPDEDGIYPNDLNSWGFHNGEVGYSSSNIHEIVLIHQGQV